MKTAWCGGAEEVGVAGVRGDSSSGSLLTDDSSGDGERRSLGRLPASFSSTSPPDVTGDGFRRGIPEGLGFGCSPRWCSI